MTLHVNWGPAMREHTREREDPRWCFHCRKRFGGAHVFLVPTEPSYYGGHWTYKCDGCNEDHRLGFGLVREG